MKFQVMNKQNAVRYTYQSPVIAKKVAIISINNVEDERPKFNLFPNLYLKSFFFDDVEKGEPNCITDKDAKEIYSFVESLIKRNIVNEIIVHCSAGVSRSAGVCAALIKIFNGDDSEIFDNPQYAPNMTCYRKVLNCHFDNEKTNIAAKKGQERNEKIWLKKIEEDNI